MMEELEIERYELSEEPRYQFDLSRRDFCKVLGGGLLVLLLVPRDGEAQQSERPSGSRRSPNLPDEIGAWIRIADDGKVHVSTGKVEVGQGIRTSLAQAVAEELRVPVESIVMIMGDTAKVPYDRGTFGSQTTPNMSPRLRQAAVATREALIDLAAESRQIPRESINAKDGKLSAAGKSIAYSELVAGHALTRSISAKDQLTPADKWVVAGKALPNLNGRAIVTGAHQYPSDQRREGMLYGRVLRPAAFDSKLMSLDASEAEKMSGVVVVRDGDFVGVAAPTQALADRALKSLKAEWSKPTGISNADLFDYLKKNPSESRGWGGESGGDRGNVDAGLSSSAVKLEAKYTVEYIAHAPLEPRAALAEWKDGKVTAWVGTQRPFGARSELAQAFSIPEDAVHVLMPDAGSGYGGKHTGEAAVEAARLAKAAGKPVKLVWTREEEFTWAYFRPAGVIDVRSAANTDGLLTAWEFHNWNSGGSGLRTPYDVPNQKVEFHSTKSPLRQGSYRALASPANHFARESHMDELAAVLKMDPLEFRLKNLKDDRLRAVLEAAAKTFGWDSRKKQEPGTGFGIACGAEKGGYVANAVEVRAQGDPLNVKLVRVVTVFECGAIINPLGLKNQVEGCVVQGIGGALLESIQFENGQILNAAFSRYPVPRFSSLPKLETVLLDRKDLNSAGAGESPMVTIAPAIANAIFDATTKRIRGLPLAPDRALLSKLRV